MDGWATTVGAVTLAFIYLGERFRAGVYLWVGMLFAIIFALRMAEPMFYMATAGLLGVLTYRIFYREEDVREDSDKDLS
jgi:hypothetical protein